MSKETKRDGGQEVSKRYEGHQGREEFRASPFFYHYGFFFNCLRS